MSKSNIDKIHSKYYKEPISNKLGNISDSSPLENCEKIQVNDFLFNIHKNDTCISDSLRSGELYEKFFISFIRQYINPDKNIIDLGANIGTHSVVYCNFLNKGKVYSFEPQPVIYNILSENMRINNCNNSLLFNLGASDSETTHYMDVNYDCKENQGSFRISSETTISNVSAIPIKCIPIDSLNIENVGYIKIDVEGHEYNALLGMKNTILKNKPLIFIEIHETSVLKEATLNTLKDFGYTSYIKLTHCDYLFFVDDIRKPVIDILVPTYHADFIWLEYCLKAIKKYASGFRNVIIVSDNDGHTIPSNITDIMENTVIYKDVGPIPPTIRHRPGYFWQQYLKLNWMEYTDADSLFILDSDEMIGRPMTPADLMDNSGKFHWIYRDWADSGDANMWKTPTREALLYDPKYEAMCVGGFVFERETTIQLIDYLKKKHGASTLLDVFFKYGATLFSEYNLYGSFILKSNSSKYYFILDDKQRDKYNYSIVKSWSYGGLTESDKQIRDNLLA